MTDYLIIRTPDGAEYAVPEGALHRYPGAVVAGKESATGVPAPLASDHADAAVETSAGTHEIPRDVTPTAGQ